MSCLVTHFTPGPGSFVGTLAGFPCLSQLSLLSPSSPPFSPLPLTPPLDSRSFSLVPGQDPGHLLGPSPAPAISKGFGSASQLRRALALGSKSSSGIQGKRKAHSPFRSLQHEGVALVERELEGLSRPPLCIWKQEDLPHSPSLLRTPTPQKNCFVRVSSEPPKANIIMNLL